MGWIPNDDALVGEHEGYAAYMAPDGRLSGTSSAAGFLTRRADADAVVAKAWRAGRTPTDEDIYDLIPWADLVGWQAACECGWIGLSWRRDQTIPGKYDGVDSEDAYLPDGSTVDDAAREAWEAHIAPFERLGRVMAAAEALATARRNLELAVAEAKVVSAGASGPE